MLAFAGLGDPGPSGSTGGVPASPTDSWMWSLPTHCYFPARVRLAFLGEMAHPDHRDLLGPQGQP